MTSISMIELEQCINDCRRVQPPHDNVLEPDLRVLGTIWGHMIYHHLGVLVLEAQGDEARAVLRRWLRSDTGEQCEACE